MSKLETLSYTRCGVPTAVGIAVQLGWFEQEFSRDGITIESIRDSADRDVRESHYDHKVDNSFRQGERSRHLGPRQGASHPPGGPHVDR